MTTGVQDLEHVRLRWMGHRIIADVGLVVDDTLDIVAAHDIGNRVHHRLLHDVPKLSDVTVHVSPRPTGADDHHQVLHHHDATAQAITRTSV